VSNLLPQNLTGDQPQPSSALITGAARRIGAQLAQALHNHGFDVAIHFHRSSQEAAALVQTLNRIRPGSSIAIAADLSTKAGCDLLVQGYEQWRSELHLLVNNASVFERTPFGQVTELQWQKQSDGNGKAAFFVTQAALSLLRKTPRANVINMCDARWDKPLPGFSAYAASKAGIVALTRCLAVELAPGIRVNAIGPGSLDWPGGNTFTPEQIKQLEANIPLHRIGSGLDIARAVLYLAEPDSYVTGQIINVDGGTSAVSV
jgi:pteridine reductase